MPAPVNGIGRGHRFAAYPRCSTDLRWRVHDERQPTRAWTRRASAVADGQAAPHRLVDGMTDRRAQVRRVARLHACSRHRARLGSNGRSCLCAALRGAASSEAMQRAVDSSGAAMLSLTAERRAVPRPPGSRSAESRRVNRAYDLAPADEARTRRLLATTLWEERRRPSNKGMKLTKLSAAWLPGMDMPPHARAGRRHGRGHRFAAYPRCSTDVRQVRQGARRWQTDAEAYPEVDDGGTAGPLGRWSAFSTARWRTISVAAVSPAFAKRSARRCVAAITLASRAGVLGQASGNARGLRPAGHDGSAASSAWSSTLAEFDEHDARSDQRTRSSPRPTDEDLRQVAERVQLAFAKATMRRSGSARPAAPSNKGMKLTKLSAAPTLAPQAALGRRCRRMPAPATAGRGHRFAAYPRCSADRGGGERTA